MAHDPKTHPWEHWHEWGDVRRALFAHDNPDLQHMGLQRVASWRVRGRVPLAIDATAQLLEVVLQDAGAGGAGGGVYRLSESMLQHNYAVVVLRAVNGAVDSGQKGTYATPVSVLASRIGLPGYEGRKGRETWAGWEVTT